MKTKTLLLVLGLISISANAGIVAGDILGRDLSLKYPVGGVAQAGHIGIWNPQGQVVEVLNEKPVIQFNSYGNFLTRSKFWGARGYPTFKNANSINTLASNQSMYVPAYTIVPSLTSPGKMEYKCVDFGFFNQCNRYANVPVQAVFRCDTFVDFLYSNTGNGSLVTWNTITPVWAYNKVTIQR